jgi:hypothetical protein
MEKGRSEFFMLPFATPFGLMIDGLPSVDATELGISFHLWHLRYLQPDRNVSGAVLHTQWHHDSVEYCKQLQTGL